MDTAILTQPKDTTYVTVIYKDSPQLPDVRELCLRELFDQARKAPLDHDLVITLRCMTMLERGRATYSE